MEGWLYNKQITSKSKLDTGVYGGKYFKKTAIVDPTDWDSNGVQITGSKAFIDYLVDHNDTFLDKGFKNIYNVLDTSGFYLFFGIQMGRKSNGTF